MNKKNIVSLIAVGLIFLLIGLGLGKSLQKQAESVQPADNQQEIDWLKSQLEMFYPPLPEEVYRVNGMVVEKQSDYLVMEAYVRVSQFPLPEGKEVEKQNIRVNTTGETAIYRLEMITDPLLLEGAAEPFEKIAVDYEEIKTGTPVTVISGDNIKGKKEISAQEIQINL
jgi:inner membrane protein involved in colicin E2 resistance